MTIAAGHLKHRLLFEGQQRTEDDFGGKSSEWVELGYVWAGTLNVGPSRDRFFRGEIEHTEDVRFIIRSRQAFALDERVADRYRLTYRGRLYKVSTITPHKLDLDYLDVSCVIWGATEEHMPVTPPPAWSGLYDGSADFDGAQNYSGA